jgi:hypothetical protein
MRALLQRVKSASVTVDGRVVGSIGHGILALVGACALPATGCGRQRVVLQESAQMTPRTTWIGW